MKIYSMTATFGKLEHETLTLQQGLNIIEGPNEWGKSTWSAFLLAMLYGLDTRAKTTKHSLADKERFAPWSGAPMEGRMELCWQGRDITIERRTKRRIPLGDFCAYETATGLPVPELTAANCGQLLLGVEQSVFRRAGFIRHSDLPVTQDEALRRRLNALVSTGDESGAADRLAEQLKELKNRCRYNRTGLLPQAETQLAEVEARLQELEHLNTQSGKLRQRLQELQQWCRELENHKKALQYTASQADARKVAQARDARDQGLSALAQLEHAAAALPREDTARREAAALQDLTARWKDLQLELQMLTPPTAPEAPESFRGLTGEDALAQAHADAASCPAGEHDPAALLWLLLAIAAAAASAVLLVLADPLWALAPAVIFLLSAAAGMLHRKHRKQRLQHYQSRYGTTDPRQWIRFAEAYCAEQEAYRHALAEYHAARSALEDRAAALEPQLKKHSRGEDPDKALYLWNQAIRCHEEYHHALRDQQKLQQHLEDLQSMARSASAPELPDTLTYDEAQTLTLLEDARAEQQRLKQRLGQYLGQMEALGDPAELRLRQQELRDRIALLEDRYVALTIALETLAEARLALQRRFAPRIAQRARELLRGLTGGRYDRLTLGSDFSLQTGAVSEDTLHDTWWRSDGTVDQLYLALRLAVAGELTPDAPLILDDALVRFDDSRLLEALRILQQESAAKQVLLFTCHSREKTLLTALSQPNSAFGAVGSLPVIR